jgi:hypothetical protein
VTTEHLLRAKIAIDRSSGKFIANAIEMIALTINKRFSLRGMPVFQFCATSALILCDGKIAMLENKKWLDLARIGFEF